MSSLELSFLSLDLLALLTLRVMLSFFFFKLLLVLFFL